MRRRSTHVCRRHIASRERRPRARGALPTNAVEGASGRPAAHRSACGRVACGEMTTSVGLEWLHPDLDRCRALIADHMSPRRWTKSEQGRSELVTEIDLAVEELLIDAIRQRAPDAAILSEESNPDPSALEQETCFVIDPIDGTEEFAAGRPGFGISIALFERGRPAAAVLDMPAHHWRFESAAGAGASLNGKGIRLSPVGALAEARLAVSATQYGMDSLRPFWDGVGAAALPH